jgi:hypothetical protein
MKPAEYFLRNFQKGRAKEISNKTKMKKIILSLILAGCLVLPVLSLADEELGAEIPDIPVTETLEKIANWLFYILLFVAAIFIVIAGVSFVTAQGDPEKFKKAKDTVLYAVVGIVVALLSRGIVALVNTVLRP